MHTAQPRTYPFAPLEALEPDAATAVELAARLGVSRRSVLRYRQHGLNVDQADRLANARGVHPAELWPTWVDDHLTVLDHDFLTGGGWRDDWLGKEATR